jgi:microcystin-dependent protein
MAFRELEEQIAALNKRISRPEVNVAPTAVVNPFAGATAPDGWLLCDSAAVSRITYAALFAAIGTTYGGGNGSTTFNVPDMRGRVPAGRDAGQSEFNSLGEAGGAKTHTLTSAEMPSHTHTQNSHNHSQNAHNHGQNAHSHQIRGPVWRESGYNVAGARGSGMPLSVDQGMRSEAEVAINQAATASNNATTATNQNAGGGQAHSILQPYLTLNFIIKT